MNDITTIFTSYSLFWLLILAWVVIDALHRKMEIGAIVFWVLIVYFLSFLGLLLYVLNRPNEPARDELFGGPLEPRRKESETAPTPRLTHQVNYNRAVDTKNMVNCEYCGESIRPIAIRCPHCHEDRSEYVDKMFKNV